MSAELPVVINITPMPRRSANTAAMKHWPWNGARSEFRSSGVRVRLSCWVEYTSGNIAKATDRVISWFCSEPMSRAMSPCNSPLVGATA